jgi:mutator protein MutT
MKKRGLGQGRWNGVGGKIEPGETVEQATIRECQEEIEVTPTQFHQVARLDFLMDSNTEPWHMDGHVFVANEWQGTPTETDEMAPQWFKLPDIPYDQMWEDDTLWLPQVLDGQLISASFSFDSTEKMIYHQVTTIDRW